MNKNNIRFKLFKLLTENNNILYDKQIIYNHISKLGIDANKCLINSDGSIDVEGSVDITNKNITKIPLKFRNVYGFFNCSFNNLNSLHNSPLFVEYDYYCSNNKLSNLEYIPKKIGGNMSCEHNNITTLRHLNSSEIMGNVNFSHNSITNLKDLKIIFQKNIDLSYNKILLLTGIQKVVKGDIYINNNFLNSLIDSPERIIGSYDIRFNNIKKIDGVSKFIGNELISNVFTKKDYINFIKNS